ncbi:hypothetical protein AVEN_221834-1 [Araneus ventricosus]|uniref:Uncharacterized protein n=1 Tax=Araneus ventricosus TaxID=182803 RepID=A0A4Y2FSV3_ARAVE|nr:hypothetical protein AVEN_221834-1 [Araneus ventricosus]
MVTSKFALTCCSLVMNFRSCRAELAADLHRKTAATLLQIKIAIWDLASLLSGYRGSPMPSGGRGGLVARSRPQDRRVAGSKTYSTEDPPCMGPVAREIIRSGQTLSRWCGAEVSRGGAVFVI